MPPVIDGLSRAIMGTIDDATVLANDLTFCRDDNTIRVDSKAYRSIGCAATIKVRHSVNQDETRRRGCDEGRA
jgi:hypothetical protein